MMRVTNEWLGRSEERPDGSIAEVPLRWAVLEPRAEKKLALHAREILRHGEAILVGFDHGTAHLAEHVIKALRDQHIRVFSYQVPCEEGEEQPVATDTQIARLTPIMEREDIGVGVAVGSGTVTDIIKAASFRRDVPWLSYGTAASMNGYTSAISALYIEGLKSTVPVRAAIGVYADPDVIAKAPLELQLAGFGDLCSKPFAGADTAIAAIITGRRIWELPAAMVDSVFTRVLASAKSLGAGEPDACAELLDALWVSGLSMTVAGSSAPASGGEHLWSHRLDMARHDQGRPPQSYHGTQVGVACGLVRPLFGAVAELDTHQVELVLSQPVPEPDPTQREFAEWIGHRHPDLSPGSREKVEAEAQIKYARTARSAIRAGISDHWPAVRAQVTRAFQHAQKIDQGLRDAGAPRLPEDIGVSDEESTRILHVCRDIRNRHTILDLAADLIR